MKDVTTPTYSVSAENITDTIPQSYFGDISSCFQTIAINDFYRTCEISNSNTSGIGNLPPPIFKYFIPPASNYDPGSIYNFIEPKSLLSQEQMEKVMYIIRDDPDIKSQSFD